ncbi:hypothetical protein SHELI_v1c11130 [Spiroplasma helicoides]|uniref:Uncharacterized protein n=1 Tax=Spiroplasma helicoides TaxID=216938 RepID=A0A1B3SMC1_9MOLU|nr:hypothetical protein [Spiroplasma helicoides]AOG61060.1 hypothetical protein SHELI_v1c11130 [Spiroplasma helicoides]
MIFLINWKQKNKLTFCNCGCNLDKMKCYLERSCFVCCCQKFIYPRKDTIFENCKLSLKICFEALARYCDNKKITAQFLSSELNINYKSAYRLLKKFKGIENIEETFL